jgi:hypothetical protein
VRKSTTRTTTPASVASNYRSQGKSAAKVAQAMWTARFSIGELQSALRAAFNMTLAQVAALLASLGIG